MNCFSAILILAVAITANASLAPLPLAYASSAWATPPQQLTVSHSGYLSTSKIVAAPIAYTTYSQPAPYWAAHGHAHHSEWVAPATIYTEAVPLEGQYVAANRGAVHSAPLPGHAKSASSINLQPAPGTW